LGNSYAQNQLPLWFSEDFSDNTNRWDDWQEQNEYVHNNALYVKEDADFRIEATVDVRSLVNNYERWGISWGRSSLYNYYYFECNQNKFRIGYYENGNYKKIKTWKKSKQLSPTLNKVVIERKGDQLIFYINGKKVHQTKFLPFFGTEISFRSSHPFPIWKKLEIYQDMGEINTNTAVKNYKAQKENLGEQINSEYIDKFPMISPDGKILYYLREDYPGDYGSQDIWYAELQEDGSWGKGKNIGSDLNNESANFVNSVFPDNNTLCISNSYVNAGNNAILAFTQRNGRGGWTQPQPMSIEQLQKQGRWVSFFLAADGRTLVFTMLRPDSYGGRDLYVSFLKQDGFFSPPLNLGPTLNTRANEHCPFLAADGKTLYFDSDGHAGYGGRDIFVSRRLDDSWTNWTKPENMGPAINTPNSDEGLIIPASGEYAYFVSNENSYGALDIYRLKLPDELKPEPTAILRGKITECEGEKGVGTLIRIYRQGREVAYANSHPKTGAYQLALAAGATYQVVVEINQAKYLKSDTIIVNLQDLEQYEERDLESVCLELKNKPSPPPKVDTLEKLVIPALPAVYFDYNKDQLTSTAQKKLDQAAKALAEGKNWKLELTGHTDAKGSLEYNQGLSERRIASVQKYLLEKGIREDQIEVKIAKGETDPVADNSSIEGRAKNRRVELKILE
jgi:OOP family OmpA-OmpF porin